MLSELMFASVPKKQDKGDRVPGISCSGLFPCPYRLYKVHKSEVWGKEITAQQYYNMEDGVDQEKQTVKRLGEAGIIIKDREVSERKVVIGKSNIPGSFDGTVTLRGKNYLWEHKAMNYDNFTLLTRWGLKCFPGYKAQVHGYMLGAGLDSCWFMAKHKDSNNYHDIEEKLDKDFILPIIEWADRIRMDNWVPGPKFIPECSYCGIRCFGEVVDLSWIKMASVPDVVGKWRKGKQLQAVGGMLEEEARLVLTGEERKEGKWIRVTEGLVEDKDLLLVEGLEVKRISGHRFSISKQRIVEEFGMEGLMKVGEEMETSHYRVRDLE